MGAMKKLSLIVAHMDIVGVISELIELECVEPIEPELTLDPPELTDLVKREVMLLHATPRGQLEILRQRFKGVDYGSPLAAKAAV